MENLIPQEVQDTLKVISELNFDDSNTLRGSIIKAIEKTDPSDIQHFYLRTKLAYIEYKLEFMIKKSLRLILPCFVCLMKVPLYLFT